ncbi:MAG: helical backbone metal receptor, partial [Ferruginibacter sp.]
TDTHAFAAVANRIVSLVPSQTELLYYFGLEEETIGITKFCIHPKQWFDTKTRIGGTKMLDLEKIKSLSPTLILANKEENVKQQIETLAGQLNVWLTDVNTLQDALSMINDIGILTGKTDKAKDIISAIQQKFATLQFAEPLKNVIYLIWQNPYMTIGGDTFISNMLSHAGYKNMYEASKRYPEITMEDIRNSDCDYLFLSSEPFPFAQKHVDELKAYLPKVKIILVDGEMFSWYGSRLLKAVDYFDKLHQNIENDS